MAENLYLYLVKFIINLLSQPTRCLFYIYIYIYIIVQNTSKTYHYSLFHPEGIFRWSLDETDCSGKFLRYFAQLYISLCLYVIEHSFVFR